MGQVITAAFTKYILNISIKMIFFVVQEMKTSAIDFYRTRVRSLAMLVTHWLPNSLTDSCLVNLIDVTLACEDANSKFVEVVTVADVVNEDHVGNSLLQIWKLTLSPKATLLFRFWAKALVKILKSGSGKILKLEFVHHFAVDICRVYKAESWSRFWS